MGLEGKVVVSGAPGTGKSTVGSFLSDALGLPFLSLDVIKETLADSLGPGDEAWSNSLGDAAAEVLFELTASFPATVVEGWWRGERRRRALREFQGCVEVFCRCEPAVAEARMRDRHGRGRHPIHRDVINPGLLDRAAYLAETVTPLGVGSVLIDVETTLGFDGARLVSDALAALKRPR